MSLASGAKLGPYEIQSPLGAGGMGEVYRAKDRRLGRDVAIKILPKEMSADAARRQRFEREAKTISSLNHPHICVLHDVGSQDGLSYLVMECLEGETLAKRLEKGPLALEQTLKFGAQIADALDKAHRSGVVHRDLKPGNIMLTQAGAKLLDFGLAKPAALLSGATLTAAATQTTPVTQEGTIVGTFQYMSPEQVEGKDLDGRSDIFSLGAVLYEMLTGQQAFPGKSQLSVASAILEREPAPISSVKPMTPPVLDHAIRRSLAKEPERRWQSAADLAAELQWIAEGGSQAGAPVPLISPRRLRERLVWMLVVAAILAAGIIAYVHSGNSSAETRVVRSTILAPEGGTFIFRGASGGAFLSPDGRSVAFIARVGKVTQLWVRSLDSFVAHPLSGTEDAAFAFWSPDSKNLGFFVPGKLKRIAASGGPAQPLCDVDFNRGGSWNQQNVIIFSRVDGEIFEIPASGGTPQRVTSLKTTRHELTHRWPSFLPDGNHFLYLASPLGSANKENTFRLGSLDGKDDKALFQGSSPIVYAIGHILYLNDKTLMARPFDPAKLEFTGEDFSVAEGVQFDPLWSNGIFSASQNGMVLYQLGKSLTTYSLLMFDRDGKQLSKLGEPAPYFVPRFSPDGKRLLFDQFDAGSGKVDIRVRDLASGDVTNVTSNPRPLSPVWSPDGTHIAYSGLKGGAPAIYIRPANTVGVEQERWTPKDALATPNDWTPDGKYLVLGERPFSTNIVHVSLLSVAGDNGPVPILEVAGANVGYGRVAPDGKWIAYVSDESGRDEIYISSFPKPVGKLQVSSAGGSIPRWRRDGNELYYMGPDNKLMAAGIAHVGTSVQVVATRILFQTAAALQMYDVAPDGSRFVVDSVASDESSAPLNLVINWTAELKKK